MNAKSGVYCQLLVVSKELAKYINDTLRVVQVDVVLGDELDWVGRQHGISGTAFQ